MEKKFSIPSLQEAREFKNLYENIFRPTVSLQFKSETDFQEAHRILGREDIKFCIWVTQNTFTVPAAWVPLFDNLKPQIADSLKIREEQQPKNRGRRVLPTREQSEKALQEAIKRLDK